MRIKKGSKLITFIGLCLFVFMLSSLLMMSKTLQNSDFRFKVNMNDNIESLNISNTVSVVCHHVFQSIKQ